MWTVFQISHRAPSIPRSPLNGRRDIHPNISFTGARARDREKGAEIVSYFRSPIEINEGTNSRVFQSHSKIVRSESRWGVTEATDGFLDPMGRCRGSFTVLCPLTGSRIEIPITRMIDAGLRGEKIVDDSATVSNIDVSFTWSNATGGPFVAPIAFSWIICRIRDCRRGRRENFISGGCSFFLFRNTTAMNQRANT